MDNFVYLIGDPKTHEAAVVDPAWNVGWITKTLQDDGYHLTHILLTHGHYDHINGTEELAKATGATVYVHPADFEQLIETGAGGEVIPRSALPKLSFEDTVQVGSITVHLMHLPGHTPGSRCLRVECKNHPMMILTGDTLFIGTIGRCDFPYSNRRDLYKTLQTLKGLPDDTLLYPAHDYGPKPSSTIGREKKSNLFLLAKTEDEFLRLLSR